MWIVIQGIRHLWYRKTNDMALSPMSWSGRTHTLLIWHKGFMEHVLQYCNELFSVKLWPDPVQTYSKLYSQGHTTMTLNQNTISLSKKMHRVLSKHDAIVNARGPFYWHGLTLIPGWISNHLLNKVLTKITYPFPASTTTTLMCGDESVVLPLIFNGCNYEEVIVKTS